MKKAIIAIVAVMMFTACGNQSGNGSATATDSIVVPGPDSSQILPALTDSAKADTVTIGGGQGKEAIAEVK